MLRQVRLKPWNQTDVLTELLICKARDTEMFLKIKVNIAADDTTPHLDGHTLVLDLASEKT